MSATMASPAEVSDQQRARFDRDGFLALDRITSLGDVATIRHEIEELFRRQAGYSEGMFFDFAGSAAKPGEFSVPQLCGPHRYAPALLRTEFHANAQAIARQLLGREARLTQDHVILKPARPPSAKAEGTTPWHQDEAFGDPGLDYHEISFWLALQDVDEINGCMRFVPGSHRRGVMPHAHPGGDPGVHAVDCSAAVDEAEVVSCPLPAGGCTLHTTTTIHGAGPNLSAAPRWAYVAVFGVDPTPSRESRVYPWLAQRETPAMRRRKRWMLRGGAFVHVWRKVAERLRRG